MKFEGTNIYIRFLDESDAEAMQLLQIKNRDFFEKYSCTREEDFYTIDFQLALVKKAIQLRDKDEKYAFGIFLKDSDTLIGNVALSEVLRGPLQSCFIGYSLDKEYNGHGYTTEAVKLAVQFAFANLKLHRIEAGVMPHNIGSIRVLEKAGFHKEGILIGFVQINLNWTNGSIWYKLLHFNIPVFSISKGGYYAPLILSVSFPLGAILFWLKRKKLLSAKTIDESIDAIEPTDEGTGSADEIQIKAGFHADE